MWTDLRSPHAMNPGPESFFWRICWYLPRCKIRTNFQPLMEAATYHVRHAFTMMIMMVQFVHQLLTLCAWTTAFAPPGAAFSTSETSSKVTKTCCLGYEHMAHMAMNHSMLPKHNCVMHWYTFNLDNPNHKKKRPLQTRFAFDIDSSQNIKQKMCCRFGVFVCVCVCGRHTPESLYTLCQLHMLQLPSQDGDPTSCHPSTWYSTVSQCFICSRNLDSQKLVRKI